MSTFTTIISSYFPDIDIFKTAFEFPDNRNTPINKDFVSYSFLNTLHFGVIKYEKDNKFVILNNSILNNIFIEPNRKEEIINIFSEAQQIYCGFCRLAYIFKIKKAKYYDIDTDLFMNPLDTLKDNIIINLYDDETRMIYKFRISDLISIINCSLSHSPEFFCDPQKIKNPYTNIPFSDAQLYNIYFTIKQSTFIMPHLFHLFFLQNFDINTFSKHNECLIRDVAIAQFIKYASDDQKFFQIHKMLESHSREMNGLIIAGGFPKQKLIAAFARYLNHYLEEAYSLNPTIRYQAKRLLKTKLIKFKNLNPSFGRRVLIRNQRRIPSTINSNTPFIFGDVESPASIINSNYRGFRYVDTFTLDSPRLTPRQLRRPRPSVAERILDSINVSTLSQTENIEISTTPPPLLPSAFMEDQDPNEIPNTSTTSLLPNILDIDNLLTLPSSHSTTPLVNSVADESVSIEDASEVDTEEVTSPLSSNGIRREIRDIRNTLNNVITDLIDETTNEILEETNQIIEENNNIEDTTSDDDENVIEYEEERGRSPRGTAPRNDLESDEESKTTTDDEDEKSQEEED